MQISATVVFFFLGLCKHIFVWTSEHVAQSYVPFELCKHNDVSNILKCVVINKMLENLEIHRFLVMMESTLYCWP